MKLAKPVPLPPTEEDCETCREPLSITEVFDTWVDLECPNGHVWTAPNYPAFQAALSGAVIS